LENVTDIIKGCIADNQTSQRLLYGRYRGFALKIVFRYIYRYERAVDVVTDGFVKLFRNIRQFELSREADNEKILMGWLKKIMVNTAIDELRRNQFMPEIGGIPENVWETHDNGQDADQLLLYKDLIILIKELPPAYRMVFNLYVIDGYTHSEIADMLKMSIGNSKSSLSRARAILQKSLKKMEEAQLCRM
jgi:RNA polymerase sigma factor (sigma-70 family)